MPKYSGGPFRIRTWIRGNLPWFFINLEVATKGDDCEKKQGLHEWYKKDDNYSACYHCEVIKEGHLWDSESNPR